MLDFILNETNINRIFVAAAIILPLGCIAGYIIFNKRFAAKPTGKVWLVAIGVFGPLAWLLWHVYNAIENAYGLDSVRALVINLILFVLVGVAFGLILRLWRKQIISKTESVPSGQPQEIKEQSED